jgi:hypothetical protein
VFLLLSAIVYAALNGVLTISGTTTTSANTDVIISVNEFYQAYNDPVDDEISADGHSITFSAELTEPNKKAALELEIENIGSTNARIYVPTFTYDEDKIADKDESLSTPKVRYESRFLTISKQVGSPETTLRDFAVSLGLTSVDIVSQQTTDDYITIVPGAIIGDTLKLTWLSSDTSLPAGEYEVTMNINFEAAT